MPLFNFKCKNCGFVIEKFQSGEDEPEIVCSECGSEDFKKVFGAWNNRKWLSAKEMYTQKIGPDAQRIMKEMSRNDNHFSDIYGEK